MRLGKWIDPSWLWALAMDKAGKLPMRVQKERIVYERKSGFEDLQHDTRRSPEPQSES